MKVVVVDDDPDTQYLVETCLRLRWPDSEVIKANTGSMGLDEIESASPDLVILDVGLPDIDGRDVLTQLRAYSDVPVVMLTGFDRDVDVAASLAARPRNTVGECLGV